MTSEAQRYLPMFGGHSGPVPVPHRRFVTCPAALPSTTRPTLTMAARPLTLHLSALSDEEYTLYTSSLSEISSPPPSPSSSKAPDGYWEDRIVSLREARGWMRGRYGVDGAVIDTILKMFSPTLGPADVLTAGQFFAAMRLVLYAQRGEEPDRSLVFVQPPSTPSKTVSTTPRSQHASSSSEPGSTLPPTPQPPHSANPFQRGGPPRPAQPRINLDHSAPLTPAPHTATSTSSGGNPFVRRNALPTPATSPTPSHFPLPPLHPANAHANALDSPPLPPRKPSFLPPPQRLPALASSTGSIRLPSSSSGKTAPPPPPKPAGLSLTSGAAHHTSELIHKSLNAARALGVQRRAESELAGARMLEVIRSTTASSPSHDSPQPPPPVPPASTKRRMAPSPPSSVSSSSIFASASEASSLERIATTRFPSRSPSPPTKPVRHNMPPPLLRSATAASVLPRSPFDGSISPSTTDSSMDPDVPTPPPRTARSKSVHASSGITPPPIPRRPRPESLQLGVGITSPFETQHTQQLPPPASGTGTGTGTLRRSVSAHHKATNSTGSGGEFIGALRESFGALGLQAKEALEHTKDRVERRHLAKHGTRNERGGLTRMEYEIEEQNTGTTVDGSDFGDEERARRGWKPLE